MADSRVVVGKKNIEYDYPDVSSSSLQSSIVLFPLVASILASQPLIQLHHGQHHPAESRSPTYGH